MKNRDKYILKVNECDMLLRLQYNLMHGCGNCILDSLTGKRIQCPEKMRNRVGHLSRLEVCSECIQKWLNEES